MSLVVTNYVPLNCYLRFGHYSRIFLRSRGFGRGHDFSVRKCDRMLRHMHSKLSDHSLGLDVHLKAYIYAMRYCKYFPFLF